MTDQPKPLTDEELDDVAAGQNWRDVTCHSCGLQARVEAKLSVFTCANHVPPLSVGFDAPPAPAPAYPETRTGPSATERLVAEVRRLRDTEHEVRLLLTPHLPPADDPAVPHTEGWTWDDVDVADLVRKVLKSVPRP